MPLSSLCWCQLIASHRYLLFNQVLDDENTMTISAGSIVTVTCFLDRKSLRFITGLLFCAISSCVASLIIVRLTMIELS